MVARAAPDPRPSTAGFAVAIVLLLLVGLTVLAHGALILAGRERAASALEARLVGRRLLARASAGPPAGVDTLPTLGPAPVPLALGGRPPLAWRTEAAALSREVALLIGVGRIERLPGEDRTARVAFVLDPSMRMARTPAVVEAGGGADLGGGAVLAAEWLTPSGPSAWGCAAELAALDSLGAVPAAPLASLVSRGGPAEATLPDLGMLPGDTLLARVSLRLTAPVEPGPVVRFGQCDAQPLNWGSPTEPEGPCGERMTLAGAEAELVIAGGEGQGVLIARGSVRLAGGARFHGFVLAGGDLILEEGATLVGAARVGGALRLRDGVVRGSACAAARGLRAASALRRPFSPPDFPRVHPL